MAGRTMICTLRTALFVVGLLWCGESFAQNYRERGSIRSGNRAYEEQDYAGSEAKYRAALEKQPASYEAAFNLGDALYQQGRYEDAVQVFDSLSQSPLLSAEQMAKVYHNMGNALFAQQKLQEAAESYKQSLRARPDDLETKYNLAYVQKLLEDQQQNQQNQQNDQNQQQNQNQEGNNGQNGDNGQDQNDGNQNRDDNGQNGGDDRQDGDDRNDNGDSGNDNGQQQNDSDGQDDSGNSSGNNPDRRDGEGQQPQGGQISREDAESILDAMQQQEDKTREKVNAQRAVGVAASGKNW